VRSLIYIRNRIGPKLLPCGIPLSTKNHREKEPLIPTRCILLHRKSCSHWMRVWLLWNHKMKFKKNNYNNHYREQKEWGKSSKFPGIPRNTGCGPVKGPCTRISRLVGSQSHTSHCCVHACIYYLFYAETVKWNFYVKTVLTVILTLVIESLYLAACQEEINYIY